MTEREYVETLRNAARDYLSQIKAPDDDMKRATERWHELRASMSPFTFVRLCDAWLQKEQSDAERS